jgi:hypothetical protein
MTTLLKILVAFLCLYASRALAQNARFNNGVITNLSEAKMVKYVDEVDFNGLGGDAKISYGRIKGSPFWKEEWKEADLFTANGKIGSAPVKLNLATNEIYFQKDGEQWVLQDQDILRVAIKSDSLEFQRHVPNLFLNKKKLDDFVAVLNKGTYQLLKYTRRTLGSADSLFGTQKRYFFRDDIHYFIRTKDMIHPVRKLNEESFLAVLPMASQYKGWIREQNLSFKTEEDLLQFLRFYNTKITVAPE